MVALLPAFFHRKVRKEMIFFFGFYLLKPEMNIVPEQQICVRIYNTSCENK